MGRAPTEEEIERARDYVGKIIQDSHRTDDELERRLREKIVRGEIMLPLNEILTIRLVEPKPKKPIDRNDKKQFSRFCKFYLWRIWEVPGVESMIESSGDKELVKLYERCRTLDKNFEVANSRAAGLWSYREQCLGLVNYFWT